MLWTQGVHQELKNQTALLKCRGRCMNKVQYRAALRLVKWLNVAGMAALFGICWYWFYAEHIRSPYYNKGNWVVIAIFAVLYLLYGRVYDAFKVSLYRISEMAYSQVLSLFFSDLIMYVVIWLLNKSVPPVWPMLFCMAAQILFSISWSYCAHRWYFKTFPPLRTAVIYDRRGGMEQLIREYGLEKKFSVEKTVPVEVCLQNEMQILDGMEAVFLCGIHSHERNRILKYCVEQDIQVYMLPRIGDILISSAKPLHLFHLPILQGTRYEPAPEYLLMKRLFDVVVSGLALVVLSPVMLGFAIAIKACDGGPVFYKQRRLTQDGKTFMVHKFRSMRVDAEMDGMARLSTGDKDDRITPVGRLIRKVRIDELPQLLDILRGDMSLVGPRPERPEIAAQYEKELPEFALRLQAKAGLTGYAQVYGKYNTTPYDKLQMDLMYIANPSFMEDLRILFATIKILFIPESTEGVAEGQITAWAQPCEMEATNS